MFRSITWVLPLFAGALIAVAHPVPTQNLRELLDQAPLVVKARILDVQQLGIAVRPEFPAEPAHVRWIASALVLQTLKGQRQSSIQIEFYTAGEIPYVNFQAGETAVLFLDDSSGSPMPLSNPYTGKLTILAESDQVQCDSDTDPRACLERELDVALHSPDRFSVLTALAQIATLGEVSDPEPLRRLGASADCEIPVAALAARVHLRDPGAVAASVARVVSPGVCASSRGVLLSALERLEDPAHATEIVPLLRSDSVDVRRAAAFSLRHMRAPVTLKALVESLAADEDFDVRYQCLAAIHEITHGGSGSLPTIDQFATAETRFIAPVKVWWTSHSTGNGANR